MRKSASSREDLAVLSNCSPPNNLAMARMHYTSLAISTLVVNWGLSFLAFLAVLVILYHSLMIRRGLGLETILIISSFSIGATLVALSTWAIVDEGQGAHQPTLSDSQLARAAKVHT